MIKKPKRLTDALKMIREVCIKHKTDHPTCDKCILLDKYGECYMLRIPSTYLEDK